MYTHQTCEYMYVHVNMYLHILHVCKLTKKYHFVKRDSWHVCTCTCMYKYMYMYYMDVHSPKISFRYKGFASYKIKATT
jgi:hypothetical protein